MLTMLLALGNSMGVLDWNLLLHYYHTVPKLALTRSNHMHVARKVHNQLFVGVLAESAWYVRCRN